MRSEINMKRIWTTASVLAAIALSAAGLPGEAPAQSGWLQDGAPVKDMPSVASSGDFGVMQIATTDSDKLVAEWLKPTPGVTVETSTQTPRNQPIVTFIVFKGCRADASGNCNVTVDYETLDPTGKSYDVTKAAEVWVGRPPAPDNNLQLSVSGLGLIIEDKDPLGAYLVRAAVTDHVAGITLRTEQTLTAVAK